MADPNGDVDLADVQSWLDRYVAAWEANDPAAISGLFTGDAEYFTHPLREPWRGIEEIVAGWDRRSDPPGSFRCEYRAVAATGDLGVARGWTRYLDEDRTGVREEYANVFLMRFAPDGRCSEFTEFFMMPDTD